MLLKCLQELQKDEAVDKQLQLNVEATRESKKWFNGDVKVVIYQTDGADITTQTQKIKLRYPKTKLNCNVALDCKVRKAIVNKKREDNMMMLDINDSKPDDPIVTAKSANDVTSVKNNEPGKVPGKQGIKMTKQNT